MTDPPALHEEALLMRRIAEGDADAYRKVVDGHLQQIFAFAFRLLNNREEAEDVAQETFLRVWRHAGRYEPSARLTTWLHTIARNQALDRLRKRRQMATPEALQEAPGSRRPSALLEQKRVAEAVQEAIEQLTPRQKEAIVLVHYQGLTQSEAAQALGANVEAVESLLARARRRLRELLGQTAHCAEKKR